MDTHAVTFYKNMIENRPEITQLFVNRSEDKESTPSTQPPPLSHLCLALFPSAWFYPTLTLLKFNLDEFGFLPEDAEAGLKRHSIDVMVMIGHAVAGINDLATIEKELKVKRECLRHKMRAKKRAVARIFGVSQHSTDNRTISPDASLHHHHARTAMRSEEGCVHLWELQGEGVEGRVRGVGARGEAC